MREKQIAPWWTEKGRGETWLWAEHGGPVPQALAAETALAQERAAEDRELQQLADNGWWC